MVCIDDVTSLISVQSIFTLVYLPLRLSFHWSARWIRIWDQFAKVLVAMKLAFLARAVIETLAIGIWPENFGSQFWLLACLTGFFYSTVQMLLKSTIETGFAIVSFFCGLSFFSPVYLSYEFTLQRITKSAFGIDIGFIGCLIISIALVIMIALVIFAVYVKGWINTLIMSTFIILDYTISFHLVVYNADWAAGLLSMTVCCNVPDIEVSSIHPDGNLCPLRFTWLDIGIMVAMILILTPMEFYRREQCIPMWVCCRRKARVLQKYRAQKRERDMGIVFDDEIETTTPLAPMRVSVPSGHGRCSDLMLERG